MKIRFSNNKVYPHLLLFNDIALQITQVLVGWMVGCGSLYTAHKTISLSIYNISTRLHGNRCVNKQNKQLCLFVVAIDHPIVDKPNHKIKTINNDKSYQETTNINSQSEKKSSSWQIGEA